MNDRLGPNSPCQCGSGKKYKHCCGRPEARARVPLKKRLIQGILIAAGVLFLIFVFTYNATAPVR
jgi:hypothetical protein